MLMSNGWAVRPPVITEIVVLSQDIIVPMIVAPGGSVCYSEH